MYKGLASGTDFTKVLYLREKEIWKEAAEEGKNTGSMQKFLTHFKVASGIFYITPFCLLQNTPYGYIILPKQGKAIITTIRYKLQGR